ncbi:MAG: YkgJ family cysteine cluster protein [Halobacteriaceae archaeon]
MEVNCEGCAGCCADWRSLADGDVDGARRGDYRPLDDVYRLVALSRDDVRALLDADLGDAMRPRLFTADEGVTVDGHTLAAVSGRPVFLVGLRKPPKPIAPVDADEASWLPACVFLDPETLQCRVHEDDVYPSECGAFPGHNLALDVETECERVERERGGERLLDDDPPDSLDALRLGPDAVGSKVFCYPDPDALAGVVDRLVAGDLTDDDRARFVGAAAASAPGTAAVNRERMAEARDRARAADSWVGRAAADWGDRRGADPDPSLGAAVEDARGAPPTPGWND